MTQAGRRGLGRLWEEERREDEYGFSRKEKLWSKWHLQKPRERLQKL